MLPFGLPCNLFHRTFGPARRATPRVYAPHGLVCDIPRVRCAVLDSQCTRLRIDGVVCESGSFMGQAIGKRSLVPKPTSIYDTSVWARKYRHDFEALQLSEEQVKLMWDEYCKVITGISHRLVRSCRTTTCCGCVVHT